MSPRPKIWAFRYTKEYKYISGLVLSVSFDVAMLLFTLI